jgi:hypothetical protein
MDTTALKVYHSRALQLANAMRLCRDDMAAYTSAVALLAVHSAISFNDTLLILLTGKRPLTQDHGQATKLTKIACKKAGIDPVGVSHLAKLLSAKTDVSYGNHAVDAEHAILLFIAAERFQAWAERNITEMRVG